MTRHDEPAEGDVAGVAEAVWDAMDLRHDGAYHVHAAECCWSFDGSMAAIEEALRPILDAAEQRGRVAALDEVVAQLQGAEPGLREPTLRVAWGYGTSQALRIAQVAQHRATERAQ